MSAGSSTHTLPGALPHSSEEEARYLKTSLRENFYLQPEVSKATGTDQCKVVTAQSTAGSGGEGIQKWQQPEAGPTLLPMSPGQKTKESACLALCTQFPKQRLFRVQRENEIRTRGPAFLLH